MFLPIVLKQNIIHVCKHSSIQCPHIFANTLSEVCWANWVIDSIYACWLPLVCVLQIIPVLLIKKNHHSWVKTGNKYFCFKKWRLGENKWPNPKFFTIVHVCLTMLLSNIHAIHLTFTIHLFAYDSMLLILLMQAFLWMQVKCVLADLWH